jgi:amidohydrolase
MRLQEISISDDACGRMLAWRHAIHANPETAFQEHHTADLVADVLQNMGFVVHRGLGVTGVVATITNGSGPTIMLRAEMDALDMQELGKPSYASTRPNKMHACGHDGHTAMLLGAADYLREQKPFEGTVHFVFQPAEENEAGGRKMIEDGLFDLFPTEAVYGMHNVPQIPRGKFAIRTGIMSANLDTFEICITGKGGHAAMPETGTDAIVAACQLVNARRQQSLSSSASLRSMAAILGTSSPRRSC